MARIFLGIPLPKTTYQELLPLYLTHKSIRAIRWVAPANYHITVYFMGEVERAILPNLKIALAKGLQNYPAFTLTFDSFFWAPKAPEARMLWAKWNKHVDFTNLVKRTDFLYTQLNPQHSYRKSPIPHITLGRFKPGTVGRNLPLDRFPSLSEIKVEQLMLWESVNESEGKVMYQEILRIPLVRG